MEENRGAIQDRLDYFLTTFHHTFDLHLENIVIWGREAALFWLISITEQQAVTEKMQLLASLAPGHHDQQQPNDSLTLGKLCAAALPGAGFSIQDDRVEAMNECLTGKAILMVDGLEGYVAMEVANNTRRAVEEPSTQTIIKGPKEGFTESSQVNMSLIRKRIIHPDLCFEKFTVGEDTRTSVYLAFMDGIINPGILEEARKRINAAKPNALFDSGMLEDYLVDKTFTPFPLIYTTERPDAVCAQLISGKAAILVEGSPFVLIIPTVFSDFFQSSEDYYQPFMISTFVRFIRYLSFLIALLFPAIYISAITYHFELIPTELLFSISSQRENLPFPVFVEAVLMEVTFEILREAGIRMPRAVGPTVSIVGGLVIGQAAVEAGIVSNTMVIIVALTAISSFASPIYNLSVATRLLRFGLLVLGALSGFYGIMMGVICMASHMTALRSFGVPYTAPYAPFMPGEHRDVLLRYPLWSLKRRPEYLNTMKPNKQPKAQNPHPPKSLMRRRRT